MAEKLVMHSESEIESPRFARTKAVLETATIADRCRSAAAKLDEMTTNAAEPDGLPPGALRQASQDVVRALVSELSAVVDAAKGDVTEGAANVCVHY
jgi:uncharacterized protein with PhoU and TrkA domain